MGLPVPTRRLAAAAGSLSLLVLVLPLGLPGSLLLVDGALLLAALADWRLAVHPRALRVERELPAVLPLDGEGVVRWRVASPSRRPLRVALADELAPSLRPASRRARLAVPARGVATATTTIRPVRRGRFDVVEIVLRVEGPLGLMARQAIVRRPAELRVHPRLRSRDEAELRIERGRLLEVGMRSAPGRGGGTELDSLRDYSVDDESRRIDWAATARAGRPIVRTYRAERNQHVLCLLDVGRTMAARVDDVPRFEHAVDAALALTHVAARLGDRVGMVAFDREVRAVVPPRTGPQQLRRVSEAVYDLQPGLVESDHRRALTTVLARFRRRALLVVFTELGERAATEGIRGALPLVLRDHLVVVAALTDPELQRWATTPVASAGEAYRRAAALAALEERRHVIAGLRALGAVVVDAPPGRLAPELADAYLGVKAAGRL